MFSMKKIGRFLGGFSVVFSSRFSWSLKDFKDSTPKIAVPVQIWFSLAKQCISMVWFPNTWFYFSRKNCIVAMFRCFKKSENKIVTTRGLFISAMSHVKPIAETRVYICHKNLKSVGIFSQFFERFRGKIYKTIFSRKWRIDWVWDSNSCKWLCTT